MASGGGRCEGGEQRTVVGAAVAADGFGGWLCDGERGVDEGLGGGDRKRGKPVRREVLRGFGVDGERMVGEDAFVRGRSMKEGA